jgi:hypothetical protein
MSGAPAAARSKSFFPEQRQQQQQPLSRPS